MKWPLLPQVDGISMAHAQVMLVLAVTVEGIARYLGAQGVR